MLLLNWYRQNPEMYFPERKQEFLQSLGVCIRAMKRIHGKEDAIQCNVFSAELTFSIPINYLS